MDNQNTEYGLPQRGRGSFLQRFQKKLYLFLNWPSPVWSSTYHAVLCATAAFFFIATIYCETEVNFKEENTYNEFAKHRLEAVVGVAEILLHIWLVLELILRVWSSGCRKHYQGFIGRLKFCFSFSFIIDVIYILIGSIALCSGIYTITRTYEIKNEDDGGYSYRQTTPSYRHVEMLWIDPKAMKALLFAQILRLCRISRIFGASTNLFAVIKENISVLLTIFQIALIGFLLFPLFVYLAENRVADTMFSSVSGALWWCVATLTTVGYGDVIPVTPQGKVIGGLAAIFGCLMLFLPGVVIGSGLIEKGKEVKANRNIRKDPAASLIQAKWRMRKYSGPRYSNVVQTIVYMKFLAAQKKFQETGKQDTQNVSNMETSHEVVCSSESRMILLEKSMMSLHDRLNLLLID